MSQEAESDLPAELDAMPPRRNIGAVLERVFSGELVGYHTEKALVAVWSGGTGFNVYDPAMWPNTDARADLADVGEIYHFNMPDHSQVDDAEEYARETLEDYGFDVVGQ